MKIGFFDSGFGGLIIAESVIKKLPRYSYVYLGDTARVPYGNRSQEVIYQFTLEAVEYLFAQDCKLIIVACNTASAEALRKIQQVYLPKHYPDRRILGVLVPTAEEAVRLSASKKIGVIATASTVSSKAFVREIKKLTPKAQITQQAAPLLVPLVENDGIAWAGPILDHYLAAFRKNNIDSLILGCTHYPIFKKAIRAKLGPKVTVISQDEVISEKLAEYLTRHPEIERALSKKSSRAFLTTDLTENMQRLSTQLFGKKIAWKKIRLN